MEQPCAVAGPRRIDPVQEYPQPRRLAQVDAFDALQLRRLRGANANTLEQPRVIAGVHFDTVEPRRIPGVHEDTMEQPRVARPRLVDRQPRRVVGVRPLDPADPLRRLAGLQATGALQQPRVAGVCPLDPAHPLRLAGPNAAAPFNSPAMERSWVLETSRTPSTQWSRAGSPY
jgi:hypothetical protein